MICVLVFSLVCSRIYAQEQSDQALYQKITLRIRNNLVMESQNLGIFTKVKVTHRDLHTETMYNI